MEEKLGAVGTLPLSITATAATKRQPETISSEPTSSRRRGAGQKRKQNNINAFSSASAPAKRMAREKPPVSHGGPTTRARQTPGNHEVSMDINVAEADCCSQVIAELPNLPLNPFGGSCGDVAASGREVKVESVDLEALEVSIDAAFESTRCRETNFHVVPVPCGWFSWTKVHHLEEVMLPTFFDGNSESRNAKMYMEIRNWIMRKFHADPNTNIEMKDLSKLSVGDTDAQQEVMEFLDYWGLINFHPFPPDAPVQIEPADICAKKVDSSLDELYRFELVQPCLPMVPKTGSETPAVSSRLLAESTTSEELVRPKGPSVEYHCNSCSADCSRKRYHCQKQADYDLCTQCFNNGKFDSEMTPLDFILMEPAEVPGLSSGRWTDQETLLLLEALELFHENWNEIAEHVATKTKAQCILHFVQMPIEDTFLDCEDEIDDNVQKSANTDNINSDSPIPLEEPLLIESKSDAFEAEPSSSPLEKSKVEDASELKAIQEASKIETNENHTLKALKEAFDATGSFPLSSGHFSFADAGNPVMALASFLVRLVEPDLATAFVRCSLKSLYSGAAGVDLATRHCFILEDPPNDKKDFASSESAVAEIIDKDDQRDKNLVPVSCANDSLVNENGKAVKDNVPEDKIPNAECTDKVSAKESEESEVKKSVENHAKESSEVKKSSDTEVKKASQCGDNSLNESSQCGGTPNELDTKSGSLPLGTKEPHLESISNMVPEDVANSGEEPKNESKKKRDSTDDDDDKTINLKHVSITALSTAAVKAKLLANQEDSQIRQLAAFLIEKQLQKVERKLRLFAELEGVICGARDIIERSRQKLQHERAQIIATRFGYPRSGGIPTNRTPIPRPPFPNMPPSSIAISKPNLAPAFQPSNHPSVNHDKASSSIGTK